MFESALGLWRGLQSTFSGRRQTFCMTTLLNESSRSCCLGLAWLLCCYSGLRVAIVEQELNDIKASVSKVTAAR